MTNRYELEQRVALEAVRAAATLCVAVRQDTGGAALEKSDRSPVTVADFGAQALICRAIRAAFPDDPIIGEEDSQALRTPEQAPLLERVHRHVRWQQPSATTEEVLGWIDAGGQREHRRRFWTLDPIDGTKGFLRNEQYAVALALLVEGRPVLAALACPNLPLDSMDAEDHRGSLYWAVQGAGSRAAPCFGDGPARTIHVSQVEQTGQARFCESVESGHSDHGESNRLAEQLGITRPAVRLDSQAKYAVVARGEADIYLRLPTRADYREKIWDHAAGWLVVSEAGGRISDVRGADLDFSQGAELRNNVGVVVSNGRLHPQVLAALA